MAFHLILDCLFFLLSNLSSFKNKEEKLVMVRYLYLQLDLCGGGAECHTHTRAHARTELVKK